jgi:hypothetical protein
MGARPERPERLMPALIHPELVVEEFIGKRPRLTGPSSSLQDAP